MNVARVALAAIAVALLAAELVRPTTFEAKRTAGLDQLGLDDLPPIVSPAMGNIDRAFVTDGADSRALTASAVISPASEIHLVGWCADPDSREPGSALIAIVDDRRRVDLSAGYHLVRPDVAAYYTAPDLSATGFAVDVPAATIGPGAHTIEMAVVTSDGSAIATLPIDVTFRVR